MVGMQRISRRGMIVRWDLMVQAGARSGMLRLHSEEQDALEALAGEINRRAVSGTGG